MLQSFVERRLLHEIRYSSLIIIKSLVSTSSAETSQETHTQDYPLKLSTKTLVKENQGVYLSKTEKEKQVFLVLFA